MELRKSPRYSVQFQLAFAGDDIVGEGTVLNLSFPGCAVSCPKKLEIDSGLELRILTPDREAPMKVDVAVVRWTEAGTAGLEFISMRHDDQERLQHLVDAL